MATEYAELEVWVVVDEDGDYAVGTDEGDAAERYAEEITAPDGLRGLRRVKVTVRVPLPKPIELSGAVECDETGAGLVTTSP